MHVDTITAEAGVECTIAKQDEISFCVQSNAALGIDRNRFTPGISRISRAKYAAISRFSFLTINSQEADAVGHFANRRGASPMWRQNTVFRLPGFSAIFGLQDCNLMIGFLTVLFAIREETADDRAIFDL